MEQMYTHLEWNQFISTAPLYFLAILFGLFLLTLMLQNKKFYRMILILPVSLISVMEYFKH